MNTPKLPEDINKNLGTSIDEFNALYKEDIILILKSKNPMMRYILATRAIDYFLTAEDDELIDFGSIDLTINNSRNEQNGMFFTSIYVNEHDIETVNILYNKLLDCIHTYDLNESKDAFNINKEYISDINVLNALLYLFKNNKTFEAYEKSFYEMYDNKLVYMKKSNNYLIRSKYYEQYFKSHSEIDIDSLNDFNSTIVIQNHIWSKFKYINNINDIMYNDDDKYNYLVPCYFIYCGINNLLEQFNYICSNKLNVWNSTVNSVFNMYINKGVDDIDSTIHNEIVNLSNFILDTTNMRHHNANLKSHNDIIIGNVKFAISIIGDNDKRIKHNIYKCIRSMYRYNKSLSGFINFVRDKLYIKFHK